MGNLEKEEPTYADVIARLNYIGITPEQIDQLTLLIDDARLNYIDSLGEMGTISISPSAVINAYQSSGVNISTLRSWVEDVLAEMRLEVDEPLWANRIYASDSDILSEASNLAIIARASKHLRMISPE